MEKVIFIPMDELNLPPKEDDEWKYVGAMEFLQHARKVCKRDGKDKCKNCIYHRYDRYNECQIMRNLRVLSNKEIADLVREVERWWREND